jgi:aldehyde dehydrogenase (NAD+)
MNDIYASAPANLPEWIAGLDLQQIVGGETLRSTSFSDVPYPVTEEVIAHAPQGDASTVDLAVRAARAAYPAWSRTSWADRRAALLRFADLLEQDAANLAMIVSAESGRPLRRSVGEMMGAVRYVRVVAGVDPHEETIAHPVADIRMVHRPLGVVAAIAPWNGPVILAVVKIATALLAGNTMVLKPSPFTPLSALRFGRLSLDAFPAGVLNVVTGGAEVGAALVAHPDVAKVSFTGSTATGKAIAQAAAADLKRVTLELGGNDAAIVLPGANLERFVETATQTGLANCGAFCGGVKRVYLHESIFDEVVERFAARLESLTLGDAFDSAVDMGPIQNRPQYERVAGLRADALASGGRLISPSTPAPTGGLFLTPTVVTGLASDSRLVAEEQFGPLLPLIAFSDPTDAVRAANDSPFGLGGSIWTSDLDLGVSLAETLEVGSAWVNQHGAFDAAVPMPLAADSGLGIDYGDYGVAEHGQAMVINVLAS